MVVQYNCKKFSPIKLGDVSEINRNEQRRNKGQHCVRYIINSYLKRVSEINQESIQEWVIRLEVCWKIHSRLLIRLPWYTYYWFHVINKVRHLTVCDDLLENSRKKDLRIYTTSLIKSLKHSLIFITYLGKHQYLDKKIEGLAFINLY